MSRETEVSKRAGGKWASASSAWGQLAITHHDGGPRQPINSKTYVLQQLQIEFRKSSSGDNIINNELYIQSFTAVATTAKAGEKHTIISN